VSLSSQAVMLHNCICNSTQPEGDNLQ